ncbi:hypothetical protein [Quadrisphaera sp. DSM 44207]|uniref:hypothetical protein n=1 Tax=Quadrisphaera sp. DSM 44207 TaxID=1881057 RepID=UPI001C408F11|nr:hypothetical protein [Quadrisphaera sp. DSM 44207]
MHDLRAWLTGRLPEGWFTGPVQLTVDRDEVTVVGPLDAPAPPVAADHGVGHEAGHEAGGGSGGGGQEELERAAAAGRIARFREETRDERIRIAREVEERWGRTVAWGARVGQHEQVFTRASVPAMTRLRQPERIVLDTLVDAGVARSRSEALAWCVRLVGEHTETWLADLRRALAAVEQLRDAGPGAGPGAPPSDSSGGGPGSEQAGEPGGGRPSAADG